jgi:hypothetical protein
MPHAKARWIDQNGRSHEWSGGVASNDRNQVKRQIYAQTGAKDVIVSNVSPSDSSLYEEKRRQHNANENARRQEQRDRLQSGSSSYIPSSNTSYSSSSSSSGSSMDAGSAIGIILVLGGIWAFITFMPWIMMGLYGAGGAWVSEKLTGQSVNDYTETKNPTSDQDKKAIIVLISALIMGGIGFVQGSGWQNSLNKDTTNQQPKVEQVRSK